MVLDQFWECWKKEYLLELSDTHWHHHGHTSPSSVTVDDVAVVQSADQPRNLWKLGRAKDVLTQRDDNVRVTSCKAAGKCQKDTFLCCHVTFLTPSSFLCHLMEYLILTTLSYQPFPLFRLTVEMSNQTNQIKLAYHLDTQVLQQHWKQTFWSLREGCCGTKHLLLLCSQTRLRCWNELG